MMTISKKVAEQIEQVYIVILIGLVPLVLTPAYSEQYFVGKMMVAGVATCILIAVNWRDVISSYEFLEVKLVLLLVVISVISTIRSIDVPTSVWGTKTAPEGLVSLMLCYGIFMVAGTIKSIHRKTLVIALSLASLVAVIGLMEYGGLIHSIISYFDGYVVDPTDLSTIGNRNFVGTFSVLMIPMVLGLIIYYSKWQLSIVLALFVGLMVVSQTRSAYISFGIILLLFILWTLDNKGHLVRTMTIISVMVGLVIIGVYVLTYILGDYRVAVRLVSLTEEFLGIFHGVSGNMGSHRVTIWYNLLKEVRSHFWFGSGPDTIEILNYNLHNSAIENLYYPKAHNHWLQMFVSQGVLYLLVYLTLLVVCLKRLLDKAKSSFLARVIIITIISYEVQGLFSISVPGNSFIYWALLGLGISKVQVD